MSLTSKIKDFLSSDALKTSTQKKQDEQKQKEQLAQKAFSSNSSSGSNRDTGTHSNSLTATNNSNKAALKTSNSTGVSKGSKQGAGISVTKINDGRFTGNLTTSSQNRYDVAKKGSGLYGSEDDFSRLKANSVRMSDSKKGNNNSKTSINGAINLSNIQSKFLDKTVQNTIKAANSKTVGALATTSKVLNAAEEKKKANANSPLGKVSNKVSGTAENILQNMRTQKAEDDAKNPYKTETAGPYVTVEQSKRLSNSDNGQALKGKSLFSAMADGFNNASSKKERENITVASENGKAPKGLIAGDKVVTNAGTYTIKNVLSDGSYVTDVGKYYTDKDGKIWNTPTNTEQTKYNYYDGYGDASKPRSISAGSPTFTDRIKGAFNAASEYRESKADSKANEYRDRQKEIYDTAVQLYNNDTSKNNYTTDSGLMTTVKVAENSGDTSGISTEGQRTLLAANDEERKMYNYMYNKYGNEAANSYLEALAYTTVNPRTAEQNTEWAEKDAENNSVLASTASVASNLVLPQVAAVGNIIQGVKNTLGVDYKPVDANSSLNSISRYGSQVRSAISESIDNSALRVGYNAVMSIADMAAQTALFGGAGGSASKLITLSMSTASGNEALLDTLERGGTQKQAFVNGVVNGALEFVSESPAVEGLFKLGKGTTGVKDIKSLATSLLQQMGIEAGGEAFANVSQTLADQIIMGDKSNYALQVSAYEDAGYTHDEAVKQATLDLYVKSTAEAAATGALAGGALGGGATAINTVTTGRNINSNSEYAKDLANTAQDIELDKKYTNTADEILKGKKVSIIDAANLKGAIQDHYSKEVSKNKPKYYEYVGLETPHKLAAAFAKTSGRDETGYQNKKFEDAWLNKSAEITNLISEYGSDPTVEARASINEYLDIADALLYSGAMSDDAQTAAAVRALANRTLNNISASAAGNHIVTDDSNITDADIDTGANTSVDTASNIEIAEGAETGSGAEVKTDATIGDAAAQAADQRDSNVTSAQNNADESAELQDDTVQSAAEQQGTSVPLTIASESSEAHIAENIAAPKAKKKINEYTHGKKRGNTVSYHKSTGEQDTSANVAAVLADLGETVDNYDVIVENPKQNTVTLIKTDDFDGKSEPTITETKKAKIDSKTGKLYYSQNTNLVGTIIPDKAEYVSDDYGGFDVEAQRQHEKAWKSKKGYDSSKLADPDYFYDYFSDVLSPVSAENSESESDSNSNSNTETAEGQDEESIKIKSTNGDLTTDELNAGMVIEYVEDTGKYTIFDLMGDSVIKEFGTPHEAVLYGKTESNVELPIRNLPDEVKKAQIGETLKKGKTKAKTKAKATTKAATSEPSAELKAFGSSKKQSAQPNKDNPLQGELNHIVPKKNYGKTDEAIKAITTANQTIGDNIGSIIRDIMKRFNVNIISKRYRNKGNALGWFNRFSGQIHTQQAEQLGVAIHELGHKLDLEYKFNESDSVKDMLDKIPNLKNELKSRGYSKADMPFETMADFIWKYLSEPDAAYEMGSYARSGNFYNTFENALSKSTLRNLKNLRGSILAFTTKDLSSRIQSQIRTREEVRQESKLHVSDLKTPSIAASKISSGFENAYGNFQQSFVDSTWAANQVVKKVEKASGHKLSPKENLQLALEFAGSNASITDTLITRGFITPDGTMTGDPSLGEVIVKAEKEAAKKGKVSRREAFDDIALYAVALHSIDRERLGQETISGDVTGGDNIAAWEKTVSELDKKYNSYLAEAVQGIYKWNDRFMQAWMVDTGLLGKGAFDSVQENYENMRKMYPHYVPMFRVMDSRYVGGKSKAMGVKPLKSVNKKGSTRQIYNPLENLMIQTNNIVQAYHNNEVGSTIHRLMNSFDPNVRETMGLYVFKIDTPMKKQAVKTEAIKDKLQAEIFDNLYNNVWTSEERKIYNDMSKEEQKQLQREVTQRDIVDSTISDVLTQFTPSGNAGAQTVTAIVDGKPVYYEIADKHLAQAILAVKPSSNVLQLVGKITRVFTALTTSKNPLFTFNNAIRDFQHGWTMIDAERWYQNFTYPVEWAAALGTAFKNEFFGERGKYAQYKSTTGFDSKYQAGADTLGKVMRQMRGSRNPFLWVVEFIEKLNTTAESAPRYVAYKRKLAATRDYKTAAKAAREATVNFNRKGTVTKELNQIVPFLGAAVAGIDQTVTLISSPETYKTKNGRMKLARALATQAIPAILLAFANTGWFDGDDEKKKEYDELSERTKNNYWVFKIGDTWFKIPRDREISAIFGTSFQEIMLNVLYPNERDEETTKEFISYLLETFMPTTSIVGSAISDAKRNTTWYGTDLVPSSQQDMLNSVETLADITDESTSTIADWLAKQINKGPKIMREYLGVLATPKGIDYVLDQMSGGVGDVLLPITTPNEQVSGLGAQLQAKYVENLDKTSRYISEAYDIKDELTALEAAEKITDEQAAWLETFSNTMSATSSSNDDPDYKTVGDYYKEIRELKSDTSISYEERVEKMNEAYGHIADMTYELVRAYKDGKEPSTTYAEKIIPDDISSVGFTADSYTDAFNKLAGGDDIDQKLAIAADNTLTDEQKEYMSQDILGTAYSKYSDMYKKLATAGVTSEQITSAKESVKGISKDKAKALTILSSGQTNAALLAETVANVDSDKISTYQAAASAGVTADVYESVTDKALEISQADGHKGITKKGLSSACKQAGLNATQTIYLKHIYNSRW